jgi:ABC-type transporter Mla MlaB component
MTDKRLSQALRLPAELTIYTAGETHAAWLAWLADAGDPPGEAAGADGLCPVDGAAVDQIDAAGLQLLVSLANTLAGQQRAMRLVNPSRPLRDACSALGVASLLDDRAADGERA